MGTFYMSDIEPCPECGATLDESCGVYLGGDCGDARRSAQEPLFDEWSLEVLCNMDDPPGEAYETSWRRADDLLKAAGPSSAILLLTVREDEDGNLESAVVLSSGYQRIPTNVILSILDTHLESLIGEEGDGSA